MPFKECHQIRKESMTLSNEKGFKNE
ncbi:hypothetical protein CDAR_610031, partial [Caerostris darwini]